MTKTDLSEALYAFLEVIYRFQRREEGLFGASWQEIYLLQHLLRSGTSSVGTLATHLAINLFDASRLVRRLGERGLVAKERRVSDRRIIEVSLTGAGRSTLDQVEQYHFDLISRNLRVLQESELASLLGTLEKLPSLLDLNGDAQKTAPPQEPHSEDKRCEDSGDRSQLRHRARHREGLGG